MRRHYGEQSACTTCGQDVQWLGKPTRRVLVRHDDGRPDCTIVQGGWMDRGMGRHCHGSHPDQDGVPVPYPHRLHRVDR